MDEADDREQLEEEDAVKPLATQHNAELMTAKRAEVRRS